MKLPMKFMLGGIPVDVIADDELIKREGCIGQSTYAKQVIVLDPSQTPRESVEQAFFHELTHWILYMMSEEKLIGNEKFVDQFGHLLYQALKTFEYPPEE